MSAGAAGAGVRPTTWRPAASTRAATRVSPEVRAEIAAAVAELEAKRESQQLEIVAFGTISSGKSSLLNALAGRPVFRTNVVGGTTDHAERNSLAGGRPRRAGRYAGAGRSARRSAGSRSGRRGEECRPRAVRRRWAAEAYESDCSKRWPRWRSGSSSASTRKTGTTREQRDELLQQIARAGGAGGEGGGRGGRAIAADEAAARARALRRHASRTRKCPSSRISARSRGG